jgi:fructokinase
MEYYYGGIEAGGTKIVCALANSPDDVLAIEEFPTSTPQETIPRIIKFFKTKIKSHQINLAALGIGSFGPLDLKKSSKTYGHITSTPKPGWQNINFVSPLEESLGTKIFLDTDVNVAALGEKKWGAGQNLENFLYLTIGTGIGGGAIIHGKPLQGLIHPEMGHIRLNQNLKLDPYQGKCPFHKNCFEGLASGPALEERWKQKAEYLEPSHPGWQLEADYIAQALCNLICSFSPERIILGGGVMQQKHLFPLIREKTRNYLNDYIQADAILHHMDEYIVPAGLGNRAGIFGAIALAKSSSNS